MFFSSEYVSVSDSGSVSTFTFSFTFSSKPQSVFRSSGVQKFRSSIFFQWEIQSLTTSDSTKAPSVFLPFLPFPSLPSPSERLTQHNTTQHNPTQPNPTQPRITTNKAGFPFPPSYVYLFCPESLLYKEQKRNGLRVPYEID